MLVEFDFALQVKHLQLKRHDALHHALLVVLGQRAPLVCIGGVVVSDQVFEQAVFIGEGLHQLRLNHRMYQHVVPGRYARQVGVDARRHVGVRPHESHHGFGSGGQVLPVRIGPCTMAEKQRLAALFHQMQRQRRDKRQTGIIV